MAMQNWRGGMGSDSTPGNLATVRCPNCDGHVYFILSGGPNRIDCPHCARPVHLDVVHNGRKWTIRRLRKGAESKGGCS
jgi:hypothetical protein